MQDLEHNIATLLEALTFSPDNIPLKKHVAQLLLRAKRYDEAIQHLHEILEQQELDGESHFYLGKALYAKGEFQQATETLRKAIQLQPTGEAYYYLSKAQFSLGQYQKAEDDYEEALNIDSSLTDEKYQEELRKKMVKAKTKLRVINHPSAPMTEEKMERPKLTFADVGGLEELKEKIRMNIVYPFQNPELFREYGKKIGGGILLYGPPGCGKTFIARATAGECKASFITIDIHQVLDMYVGQSERNLHDIFEQARMETPAIIFIDEIDAIGGSRQQQRYSATRALTNQLLNELDGVASNNENILVIGATNTPWFVDTALRRPGRFDRILFVSPPDLQARIEILRLHLQDKPVDDIDLVTIASKMERYSGADIQAVCDIAVEEAIRVVMKTGKRYRIQTEDLLSAVEQVKPSTTEWLRTAKNYATYSNQSGLYDDILFYLNKK